LEAATTETGANVMKQLMQIEQLMASRNELAQAASVIVK
jgi:hypothetical protein|tara:strand:+ start:636 stop:752 length:117 start_codon:yes stop_codon:yes gene_type:complete